MGLRLLPSCITGSWSVRRHAGKTHRKWSGPTIRSCPTRAGGEAVAQQGPDRQPAVGVANLFAFARGTRCVGDRDLGDLLAHTAELGGYLGAELEAKALQINLRDQ